MERVKVVSALQKGKMETHAHKCDACHRYYIHDHAKGRTSHVHRKPLCPYYECPNRVAETATMRTWPVSESYIRSKGIYLSERVVEATCAPEKGSGTWPVIAKLVTGLKERVIHWSSVAITTTSGTHSYSTIRQIWIHGCRGKYLTRTLKDIPTQLKFLTQFSIEHIVKKGRVVVDRIRAKAKNLSPYYPWFVRAKNPPEEVYHDALDNLPTMVREERLPPPSPPGGGNLRKEGIEQKTENISDRVMIAAAKGITVDPKPPSGVSVKIVNPHVGQSTIKALYSHEGCYRTAIIPDDPEDIMPLLIGTPEAMKQFRIRNPDLTREDEIQLRKVANKLGDTYASKNIEKLLAYAVREKVCIPQYMQIFDPTLQMRFQEPQRKADAWLAAQRDRTVITKQEAEWINQQYQSMSTQRNTQLVKEKTNLRVKPNMNDFWSQPNAREVYSRWMDSRGGRLD